MFEVKLQQKLMFGVKLQISFRGSAKIWPVFKLNLTQEVHTVWQNSQFHPPQLSSKAQMRP